MSDSAKRLSAALAGHYRIERELGAGGMATVYLAEDLKHHRKVALKVLRPELAATMGSERFAREIEVAARLVHPHILGLIDSGDIDGFFYYVMPYVEGETLRDRLARSGELPVHEAVRLLGEIADALAVAHKAGVVHRDIKPENILLSGRHAMVMDFGVAKAVTEASGRQQLTTAGVALGTPAYMAPEQATADPQLDGRVDIYSLGVLAYEMLTGYPPFHGLNPQQTLAAHVTQAPMAVGQRRPGLSPALESVVMRCLAKRPADRFQAADELVAVLEPLATPTGGMTPTQTQPVQGVTLGTTAAGRRSPIGAGVGMLLLLLGLGWLAFRGRTVRVIQPDRVQLTFTGNARTPALSPNGQRLAYSVRRCEGEGECALDVVVQDVEGAGTSTVLRGWASIWSIQWSGDARYLLIHGFEHPTGRWGPFSVPSLGGGTPRFLGCCDGIIATGGTVLVTRNVGGVAATWVLRLSLADGVALDSFTVPHVPGEGERALPLDSQGRIIVRRANFGYLQFQSAGPRGTPIDSLRIEDPGITNSTEVYPPGGYVLFAQRRAGGIDDYDLLAVRVRANGHFVPRPDTVLRGLKGSWGSQPNGMLLNATGPTDYEVWSLRRDSPGSMHFTRRRLAASTVLVGGSPAPSGNGVLLYRRVVQGGKALTQLSVMPSDSGAEVPLGLPRAYSDWEWAPEERSLFAAITRGDTIDIVELDLGTGKDRPVLSFPAEERAAYAPLPRGGLALLTQTGIELRLRGVPGRGDTSFTYPEVEGYMSWAKPSPDGRDLVTVGWDRGTDSILVHRLSLATGTRTRLAAFYADGMDEPEWLTDGSLLIPIRETGSRSAWYRLPAGGGRAMRLGSPPWGTDATFRFSADGRLAVARVAITRPDIYLIRNFRDLLRH